MIYKLKKLFYTSFLGGIYFEFLLWYDRIKFKYSNRKSIVNAAKTTIVYNQIKALYDEGVGKIKLEVNKLTKTKTKEEYDLILKNISDLLTFSKGNLEKEAEALHKAYVFKDADVKSATDMAKMVDTRIHHYYDLHKHKTTRETLRQIRKARSEGNEELAIQLEREFNNGRIRKS